MYHTHLPLANICSTCIIPATYAVMRFSNVFWVGELFKAEVRISANAEPGILAG